MQIIATRWWQMLMDSVPFRVASRAAVHRASGSGASGRGVAAKTLKAAAADLRV